VSDSNLLLPRTALLELHNKAQWRVCIFFPLTLFSDMAEVF